MAQSGRSHMLDLERPLLGAERKSDCEGNKSFDDPGCVKTPTSNFRVERLSRLHWIRKEPLWQVP